MSCSFTATDIAIGTVVEVRRLELRRGDESLGVYVGGRDFPRAFFYVAEAEEQRKTAKEVRLLAFDTEEKRRLLFARPLGETFRRGLRQFRILSFTERCYITRPFEFPGYRVVPVDPGPLGIDEADVLNHLLRQAGMACQVLPEDWARNRARSRPMVVFDFPKVVAAGFEEAYALAKTQRDVVINLIAFHRASKAIPLVTFVEDIDSKEHRAVEEWSHFQGNLLGGFLSGEDQTMYIRSAAKLAQEPVVALWASLMAEAEQETNVNVLFLRYWSVLETIATAQVIEGQPVTDFNGAPINQGGQDVVTWRHTGTTGAVYLLLKRDMLAREYSQNFFDGPQGEDLWRMVTLWYGFRNATAHSGGFLPGSPLLVGQRYYADVLAAHNYAVANNLMNSRDSRGYVGSLREAARFVVAKEIS